MASLISPETFNSLKSLSKEYRITNSSFNPNRAKQLARIQLSELIKKSTETPADSFSISLKNWLRSLSPSSLFQVFSTYNPLLCTYLIQMNLKNISDSSYDFALVENPEKKLQEFDLNKLFYMRKKQALNKDNKYFTEKELERLLRFMDTEDYLDTLSVETKMLRNLDKLFDLFDSITEGRAFKVPCRAYWDNINKKWLHEYPSWHIPCKFNSLAAWACACLERNLWINYWKQNQLDCRYPEETTPYNVSCKILSSVETVLALPEFFRSLPKPTKEDLIGDNVTLTRTFQEIKKKMESCNPNKFVAKNSSHHAYYASSHDLKNYQNSECIEDLIRVFYHNSEEVLIEYLLCSPLERTATIFDLTARIVALRIKELHTQRIAEEIILEARPVKKTPKKNQRKKKKKKVSKPKVKEENVEKETKVFTDEIVKKAMKEMYEFIVKAEVEEEEKVKEEEGLKVEKVEEEVVEEFEEDEFQVVNQKKKMRRLQPQQKARVEFCPHRQPIKNAEQKSQVKPQPMKPEKPARSLWATQATSQSSCSISNSAEFPPLASNSSSQQNQSALHTEIIQLVNNITSKVYKKTQYINLVLQQINKIVADLFRGNIYLYGSYATGLAIESSDVDLAVNMFESMSREKIQQVCLDLGGILEKLPFVVSCKKITTASVPVIKLETELSIYSGSNLTVMIDITFMNINEGGHLVLEAVFFAKDLLILFPHIHYLAIILKNFLYMQKLNSVYLGGLSSYSLVIWITAAINSMSIVPDDIGEILMHFLDFFGNKFDPKKTGVNITNRESVFLLDKSNEHAVTIDPVNRDNNTTRATYRVDAVLKAFGLVHSRLSESISKGKCRNLLKQAFKKINNFS